MPDRPFDTRRSTYAALWIVGLAAGWFEAAIVIDLRELFYPEGFRFPVEVMPARLLAVEVVREACSLVLLAGIGFLAAGRLAGRIGAFLLLFGIWDLVYYAGLKLVLDWPEAWSTWDLLFLIPLPWVGPVWAPALVALACVTAGSYLFWTASRPRAYRHSDTALMLASALAIVGSFLAEWRVVVDLESPEYFPAWLFWAGLASGSWGFWRAERRPAR
jgi:hypothetical protein